MSEEQRPASRPGGLRASDEDRERLAEELRDHAVAGRLDTDELEERLRAAYGARTQTELAALRDDLPEMPQSAALTHAARRAQLTRRVLQETGGSLGVFVVCCGVWALSGAHGSFWPGWVLLIVAVTVVRNGWALFGPAPDLDAVEAQLEARRQKRGDHRQRAYERRDRRLDR